MQDEAHAIALVSSTGALFEAEIPVAFESPEADRSSVARFGLVGLYVGVIPIALGLLWYPVLRRLGRRGMAFVLALTVGLLAFLVADMWGEAQEVALDVAGSFSAPVLIPVLALLTALLLVTVGNALRSRTPAGESIGGLRLAYQIAVGIGLHNLGEGLAIGSAFALGETALGVFLIVGFTLHNVTEGVGIAAPVVKERRPSLWHFAGLAAVAGASGDHRHLDRRLHLLGALDDRLPGDRHRRHRAGDLGGRPADPAQPGPRRRAALHLEHPRRHHGRDCGDVRDGVAGVSREVEQLGRGMRMAVNVGADGNPPGCPRPRA